MADYILSVFFYNICILMTEFKSGIPVQLPVINRFMCALFLQSQCINYIFHQITKRNNKRNKHTIQVLKRYEYIYILETFKKIK